MGCFTSCYRAAFDRVGSRSGKCKSCSINGSDCNNWLTGSTSVEASVTFSDLTDHLGRMALLNDFAVTITSAFWIREQIAQRMFALLQRAFGTERIHMVVLSPDSNGLQSYSNGEDHRFTNHVIR